MSQSERSLTELARQMQLEARLREELGVDKSQPKTVPSKDTPPKNAVVLGSSAKRPRINIPHDFEPSVTESPVSAEQLKGPTVKITDPSGKVIEKPAVVRGALHGLRRRISPNAAEREYQEWENKIREEQLTHEEKRELRAAGQQMIDNRKDADLAHLTDPLQSVNMVVSPVSMRPEAALRRDPAKLYRMAIQGVSQRSEPEKLIKYIAETVAEPVTRTLCLTAVAAGTRESLKHTMADIISPSTSELAPHVEPIENLLAKGSLNPDICLTVAFPRNKGELLQKLYSMGIPAERLSDAEKHIKNLVHKALTLDEIVAIGAARSVDKSDVRMTHAPKIVPVLDRFNFEHIDHGADFDALARIAVSTANPELAERAIREIMIKLSEDGNLDRIRHSFGTLVSMVTKLAHDLPNEKALDKIPDAPALLIKTGYRDDGVPSSLVAISPLGSGLEGIAVLNSSTRNPNTSLHGIEGIFSTKYSKSGSGFLEAIQDEVYTLATTITETETGPDGKPTKNTQRITALPLIDPATLKLLGMFSPTPVDILVLQLASELCPIETAELEAALAVCRANTNQSGSIDRDEQLLETGAYAATAIDNRKFPHLTRYNRTIATHAAEAAATLIHPFIGSSTTDKTSEASVSDVTAAKGAARLAYGILKTADTRILAEAEGPLLSAIRKRAPREIVTTGELCDILTAQLSNPHVKKDSLSLAHATEVPCNFLPDIVRGLIPSAEEASKQALTGNMTPGTIFDDKAIVGLEFDLLAALPSNPNSILPRQLRIPNYPMSGIPHGPLAPLMDITLTKAQEYHHDVKEFGLHTNPPIDRQTATLATAIELIKATAANYAQAESQLNEANQRVQTLRGLHEREETGETKAVNMANLGTLTATVSRLSETASISLQIAERARIVAAKLCSDVGAKLYEVPENQIIEITPTSEPSADVLRRRNLERAIFDTDLDRLNAQKLGISDSALEEAESTTEELNTVLGPSLAKRFIQNVIDQSLNNAIYDLYALDSNGRLKLSLQKQQMERIKPILRKVIDLVNISPEG